MSNSTDLSCREFILALASASPAPGGGGAAALVGAIGTALGNMVGSLTVGKPKYAEVEAEVWELKARSDALEQRLLALIAQDAEVFLPLSRAYGLPKETEEQAAHKAQVMEECLSQCAQVPLEIMQACAEAVDLLQRLEQIGTAIAISDVGCGALCLRAALQAADLNVRVNTKLMQNRDEAKIVNAQAKLLLTEYLPRIDQIYASVRSRY